MCQFLRRRSCSPGAEEEAGTQATVLDWGQGVHCEHPGEPNRGGHVTITHQMLALSFRAFRTQALHGLA